MSTEFIWLLPTSGDSRYGEARHLRRAERDPLSVPPFSVGVSDPRGTSFNYFDYLHQVARAADLTGFNGIQIQHDLDGDEAWIVAGYVARSTKHLKIIAEFEASWGSAVYAAKNAVSFQRFTNSRFAWNIHRGSDLQQRRRHGDFVSDEDISARIEEFLTVMRGVQTSAPFSFQGRFFEVKDGGFKGPLANHPLTSIYLSGETEEAYQLSARHADVHLFAAQPIEELQPRVALLRQHAERHKRTVAPGLRIDILARETKEEAVRDARRFWDQSRYQLGEKAPDIQANLWRNFSTDRNGALATLVGSYEEVIEQLAGYAKAGIGSFALSALPHLEEAYRIGEHVLPALKHAIGQSQLQAA
jgi:alkanesulfonate monooxygenase